ncbi:glutathione S-transferase [Rheinheimera sp. A13L]|uniref:glutathione S-transferase family protein n=1 Tax=Rheinheimera sp. A13L TaxID=506534 RepID=UPI0002124993|nr:glutathione S-transferase family protein [Rheinheimera sp. A13L]EGM76122.1 glutathione S-transferase [Rheinheimera sp. A13L]
MYQLYYSPGTASMAPHILLEELSVPYELVLTDTAIGSHKKADYLALNPNGTIPTLVDRGQVIFETAAICLHLVDSHPEKNLFPAPGTLERAEAYKWLIWLSATLQSTLVVYFYPERWVSSEQNAADVKRHAEQKAQGLLEQMDKHLASHCSPWFLGEEFSLIDIYAMMLCRWTRHFNEKKARDFPFIALWVQKVLARPAVQKVMDYDGLVKPYV